MDKVIFKKLHNDAQIPKFAKPGDAGMDLYAIEDVTLSARKVGLVKTGLAMELPAGTEAQVRSRSGLALKSNIFVLNSPGTIDEGYRGEIGVILANFSDNDFHIKKGDRIAQMVIAKLHAFETAETTDELSSTDRGSGGFGSSGVGKK